MPQLGVTPEWDSLNSIEMIFLLEERYQADIGIDAWAFVEDLDSLADLIKSLKDK
jgi:acyl carrier protein